MQILGIRKLFKESPNGMKLKTFIERANYFHIKMYKNLIASYRINKT